MASEDQLALQLAVRAADRAARLGFTMSSDNETARLLSVLAAAVPSGGRILEIGTGVGHGTAALVAGLGERGDAAIVTIDVDTARSAATQEDAWPPYVEFVVGDAVEALPALGQFDLIFADASAGKHVGLNLTIAALRPGGLLLVDDMAPRQNGDAEMQAKQDRVRAELDAHPALISCAIAWSTGLVLCAKRETG